MNLDGYANGDPANNSLPFGLCAGPNDLKCTDNGKGPGVLGTMLAGIGQSIQNWWDSHKDRMITATAHPNGRD